MGKLSWDAIPIHQPIPMAASLFIVFACLGVLALVTWKGWWPYLWREWLTSVDHKRIGVMYVLLSLVLMLRGFIDAIMMRSQLAVAAGGAQGYLPPEHYDQIFTAHGTIMIFFVAMPFMVGLMNFAVPLQIGARDVAFPVLNAISFWLTAAGALLVNISLVVGEFARTGWLAYPPLSELQFSPGVGVDYYLWALQIAGVGSLLAGINMVTTILKLRAPGMRYMRMPVFCWTALASSMLIVAAFPILTATLGMLLLDRYGGMHFFTNDGGGNAMLYFNLIWAWGHPEVYILILPAFGIFSEVIATFSGKRLFGYRSMVLATLAICVLSFMVWLHHFFTMGAGADVNGFFGIMTMIIAVPTGVKVFNWLFTLYGGRIRFELPLMWAIGFIVTFVIGGMTGVLMAVPPADFVLHNSLFLVAHFHNVIIGGVVFGGMAGYTYWFPKAFGFTLDRRLGILSFWCWLIGFYLAFVPLYVLGLLGMTRRMQHYADTGWQPYLIVAEAGAIVILCGILATIAQLVVSVRTRRSRRDRTGDPWDGRTLEWSMASPAPAYNFAALPRVESLDAFWAAKQAGAPARARAREPIEVPKNSANGFVTAFFAVITGFALIWHIAWMTILGLACAVATLLVFAWTDRESAQAAIPAAAQDGGPAPVRIVVAYGFWIFLISDIILFSALFAAYAVLCGQTAAGPRAHDLFDLHRVAIQTVCLLLSSYTCGLGTLAVERRRVSVFYLYFALTFALGAVFLGLEIREFSGMVASGAGPSKSAFLSAFFSLVGLHGLHITIGLLWLAFMTAQVRIKGPRAFVLRRLQCFGLFWHTLDIIWVALLSLVYLMGAR